MNSNRGVPATVERSIAIGRWSRMSRFSNGTLWTRRATIAFNVASVGEGEPV
jgi:hypothetical protein